MGKSYLFENYALKYAFSSDTKTNLLYAQQMGLRERFQRCVAQTAREKYAYCIINTGLHCESESLRIQTNIFGEFESLGNYPLLFT